MIEILATTGLLLLAKPEVLAGALECILRVAFSVSRESKVIVAVGERTVVRVLRKKRKPKARSPATKAHAGPRRVSGR